ncbi:asparagine synthase (glutamine-hydrolyzing) [Cohnella boryungensis]|uniref:asparagine synthase (glutamine-hydrolyzing) n=1 Tax=Cohnella boryungensis TaxID=768479 RepID=A0ABV8S7A8_9BACL
MCGIVGALSFKNSSFRVSEDYITKMRDTMVHRGPNGGDTWVDQSGKIGLGHRRLSIIDLSNLANQPMCNEDETLWVAFNGEIYNHAEVRAELVRTGNHKWKTDHSDTEVILHAFEEWGIECIHKFRGMFAIALWDTKEKNLWLIRDRIGIKPIYYSIHNQRIVFASEIKALLQDPDQKRAVNEEAFYHYLSFLTTPAPQTLFEGILKLEPGTWLKIGEDGSIKKNKYWDVWDHTKPLTDKTESEISQMVLNELRTAVQYRKVSDVPVGVFLSGGIDSSTNAALFSEGEQQAVKAYTIGYEGEYDTYKNETEYARMMADTVGAEYNELLLTIDDLMDFLPKMVYLQDEPIADPVCVPVYYVSKMAREDGTIVCQVGEGADELFWGYQSWKVSLNLQKMNELPVPRFLKKMGLAGLKALGKDQSLQYELLRRGANDQPVFWGGAEAFTEAQKKRLISSRLQKKFKDKSSWSVLSPIYEKFKEKAWDKSHLNWMTYLDLNMRLPELLLMRVDKMSMGVSLEGRVPFLDHKFVELAMSIPADMKTKDGVSKYLLKKAVRGVIPDEIIDRKKQGFGVPVYEWFFDKLGEETKRELSSFCDKTDFLNKDEVMKLIDQKNGPKVWYLLNFALWWKEFINDQ